MKAHSQYGEDRRILDYFGDHVGRFLDVGANDGYTFSNTGQLAERGWSGVCVEPSPMATPNLMSYHTGRPVCVVHAAMGLSAGMVKFWECPDALMSSVDPGQAVKFPHLKFTTLFVCSITWGQLLAQFPGPFDFVNIDVEGLNSLVAEAMPIDQVDARAVCLEDDLGERRNRVIGHFNNAGYTAEKIGGNLLFLR